MNFITGLFIGATIGMWTIGLLMEHTNKYVDLIENNKTEICKEYIK